MTDETRDQLAAKAAGVHPDEVRQLREEWNTSRTGIILRQLFRDRLQDQITERLTKLEKCDIDNLHNIQGQVAAFKMALSIVTENPLNNE